MYCQLLCFDEIFFYTLKELATSVFALKNIKTKKHGVSKLEFIFITMIKIII